MPSSHRAARGQMSDSLLTALFIILSGGLQDAYTYLCRGKVFANAQTGNIVLLSAYLFEGDTARAVRYLVPVLSFALGVFVAECIHRRFKRMEKIHWRQLIILSEIVLLFAVGFLPQEQNMAANMLVSFVCAMQVQTFRKVRGHAYASTMCIGNLRSGFTDGYLTGKRDKTMFGYRTKDDVQSADKVLKSLAALYEKETPRVGVSMAFSLTETESALTVSDGENARTVTGDAPEKAINRALDAASAEKNLVKTGGTPFAVTDFTADIAPGYMLPASALNALRREALSELLDARGAAKPWPRSDVPAPAAPEKRDRSRTGALWARFAELSQIPAGESFDKILLPVERITPEIIETFGERLIGVLPAILWPADEEALEARLAALKEAGLREVYGDNIYAIPLTRRRGLTLHGGAGLNILNTEALRHYEEEGLASVTASFELSMRGIKSLGGSIPLGAIVYGRLPLMHFRNCPLRAQIGCAACRARGELTDRRGVKFPVECGEKKYSTLLNSVPLHIADKDLRGLDHCILWFTRESAAECAAVAADYRAGRKSERERTGGLYYRELL